MPARLAAILALLLPLPPMPPAVRGAAIRSAFPASGQQQAEACRTGTTVDPATTLERALEVMGVRAAAGRVLHFETAASGLAREQSDRWYPPYLRAFYEREYWIDPETGNQRVAYDLTWPAGGIPHTVVLETGDARYVVRDTLMIPSSGGPSTARLLDPWAVVLDWRGDASVRYREECRYRDYWRSVLERDVGDGVERLYLDPKSGYPVKLDFEEPHYLWGQERIEFVYSTWITTPDGTGSYPAAAFRLEDGETVEAQTVQGSTMALLDRADAPDLKEPPSTATPAPPAPRRPSVDDAPDTVRVSDHTFLLRNRIYTETVTLQGDTVYLLDATSGETRARADSAWIAKLFPGDHPVTVVVTDVAWPHIAGLRFWVARGARVVTHAASGPFLHKVTARRWTRAPDALERSSAPRGDRLRMATVTDSLSLAGGRVRLYPIDGVASEGALMVWIPGDGYLWASDFVQTVGEASEYAAEVYRATRRVGIAPDRFAAEHMPLTPWETLLKVISP